MACANCGTTILFGGKKDGDRRYCNNECYEADKINRLTETIPDMEAEKLAADIHSGSCPKCNGVGPVEIHKSYSVYSVILYTKWQTLEHLVCKKCATKKQAIDLAGSFLFGWWGVPFGLIITPVQMIKNIIAMLRSPDERKASEALKQHARLILASHKMESA